VKEFLTTIEFIETCSNFEPDERLNIIAGDIGIASGTLRSRRVDIEKILNFVSRIDEKYHEITGNVVRQKNIFFDTTLHDSISSDIRSLIILGMTNQNFQINIVLRHLIETFVMTLWADLITNFQGSLNYFLKPKEWKEYRQKQKLFWDYNEKYPHNIIKERLERIRLLNMSKQNSKEFPKWYFAHANKNDLKILFSLPICSECIKKRGKEINYEKSTLGKQSRKTGKEDSRANFKTDFRLACCFCNKQKITTGYAMGIPETKDIINMLAFIIDKKLTNELRGLQKIYAYLSDNFVHFSTAIHPDKRPPLYDFGNRKGVLWGLKGVVFCLEFLDPLMKYYFKKLTRTYS